MPSDSGWVVAIVGGTVATVVGGLILYLLVPEKSSSERPSEVRWSVTSPTLPADNQSDAPRTAPSIPSSVCSTPIGFGRPIVRGNEEEAEFNYQRGKTCSVEGNLGLACDNWVRALLTTQSKEKKGTLRALIRGKCPTDGLVLGED